MKLSIIIPCYNCKPTLQEAVDSCYIQGFSDDEFEIVMVDDGSTDGTRELLQTLSKEHNNIKLFFHAENKGGGAARNTAVENSTADVIFCLDSDDLLPEGTMKRMYSFLEEKKCDAVGIHRSIKFNNVNITDIAFTNTFSYEGERIPIESLLEKNDVMCPLYSTFMHTKDAFYKAGQYPTSHGFDTQGFAWRFLLSGGIAYTCPNAEYLHRINFHESYYLREASAGKINYNWRDVLLEHFNTFTPTAQQFLLNFDCKNFSKNLFEEFKKIPNPFIDKLNERLGEDNAFSGELPNRTFISRNSLQGIWYRILYRLKNLKLSL